MRLLGVLFVFVYVWGIITYITYIHNDINMIHSKLLLGKQKLGLMTWENVKSTQVEL